MSSSTPLTGKQRQYLRALAHALKPIVQIGHGGCTDGIAKELDRALETHELVKIRVGRECPLETKAIATLLVEATKSQLAQIVGRTLVVYRERAKQPDIQLPAAKQD